MEENNKYNTSVDLRLKRFIENIEALEILKKETNDDILAVYQEAKTAGFDVKIVRKIVSLRKMEPNKRMEEAQLLEAYKEALGMVE